MKVTQLLVNSTIFTLQVPRECLEPQRRLHHVRHANIELSYVNATVEILVVLSCFGMEKEHCSKKCPTSRNLKAVNNQYELYRLVTVSYSGRGPRTSRVAIEENF